MFLIIVNKYIAHHSSLKKNECGDIDVCDFLTFIDRINCKSTPIPPMHLYVRMLMLYATRACK